MTLAVGVLKPILGKLNIFAILDDSLAGHKNIEPCFEGIMNSQLMTIQVKCASLAMIDKDCWFGDGAAYLAVGQILQEQDFCLLE